MVHFKYLGRVLYKSHNVFPALFSNLGKARKYWGFFGYILVIHGVYKNVSDLSYSVLVQDLFIYRSYTLELNVTTLIDLEVSQLGFIAGKESLKLQIQLRGHGNIHTQKTS